MGRNGEGMREGIPAGKENVKKYSQQGQGNLIWTMSQEDVRLQSHLYPLGPFGCKRRTPNLTQRFRGHLYGCSQAQRGLGTRHGKDTSRATPGSVGSRNCVHQNPQAPRLRIFLLQQSFPNFRHLQLPSRLLSFALYYLFYYPFFL